MIKSIGRIRTCIIAMLMLLAVAFVLMGSVYAATWNEGYYIGQGKYKGFVDTDGTTFTISSGTSVSQKATFTKNVPSTVKGGYYKSSYVSKLKGNNTTTMSGSYTITTAGEYKFYIYNGSSDAVTLSKMVVTF